MPKLNTIIIAFIIFINYQSLYAETNLQKNDFAYGNEIEITNNKSLIELQLNSEFYLGIKNSNFNDMAVFNSKNEAVPYIITDKKPATQQLNLEPISLVHFPVYLEASNESDFSNIQIATSQDGAIININSNAINQSKKKLNGYVIDASKLQKPIEKLKFDLGSLQENNFIKLQIAGSDDLKDWQAIDCYAVLANFKFNGESLLQDEAHLGGTKYKYYRITWPNYQQEFKFQQLQAHFATEYQSQTSPPEWRTTAGNKAPEINGQPTYNFDLGGYFPVDALKFRFTDTNSIARFSIEATNDLNGPWSLINSETMYTLQREGTNVEKLTMNFTKTRYRYWRIALVSGKDGIGNNFPEVSFGWSANLLRFLARGEGPYILAYGSALVSNPPQTDLLTAIDNAEVGYANLKNQISLGGAEKLTKQNETSFPLKKIILWSVLILAVIFLGNMALQVKKQIPPT